MSNEPRPPTRNRIIRGSAAAERRSASRRRVVWRRRATAVAVLVVGYALLGWLSSSRRAHDGSARLGTLATPRHGPSRSPQHFAVSRLPYTLPVALQDAAAVPVGSGRAVLLGGLNAADTSTATVSVLDAGGVTASSQLPEAQHDAQGAMLDGLVYVFGG